MVIAWVMSRLVLKGREGDAPGRKGINGLENVDDKGPLEQES